jgi:diguanylate cyclase (GGDEF)-like protein/PAS domain S-box-containing protein
VSLLNRKVQLAFGSAVLTLLVVGAISYRSMIVASESNRWVRHTHAVLDNIQDLRFAWESISSGCRGFVLTGKKSYFDSYGAGVLKAKHDVAAVRQLTADNPAQQRELPTLEGLIVEKVQRAELVSGLRRTQGLTAAADAILNGPDERITAEFHGVADKLQDEELRLLVIRDADTRRRLSQTKSGLMFGALLGLLISGAAPWSAQRDSSSRWFAERALRDSDEKYRMLLDGILDYGIIMLDPQGQVVSWSAGAQRIKGYTAEQIIGHNFSCFFPRKDVARGRPEEVLRLTAASGRHEEHGMRVRRDGSQFLADVTFTALRDTVGNLRGFSEISRDLSESKESEAKYRGLLEAAPDAMLVVNQGGEIVLLNVQAEKQFGYHRDELVGQKVKNIIPDGFAERLIADALRSAEDALAQQISTGIELYGRRKDGSGFPIEIMLSPLENAEGTLVTAAIRDITLRKEAEAQLLQKVDELNRSNEDLVELAYASRSMTQRITHSAEHDALTGLPNRLLLGDRLGQAIALARRHTFQVAVLFLDLDGFKHINDSLGHPIGDKLLQSIATRLVGCLRAPDTVSRHGGDEFVVLLPEIRKPEDVDITARRLLQRLAETHSIDQHDLHVTASIGVSIYPDDGADAETLIKNADTAMYQAKENGRQGCQFFRPAMNVRAVERQSIEEHLRHALERREFALHYQPIVDLKTGAITGAEALLRWSHPTRGSVPPLQFIPIAEDSGLILPIGAWVLREACAQARTWADAGLPMLTMAVNVSAMQLRNEGFLDELFTILSETRADPKYLELELTESSLMKPAEVTASILSTLRGKGVQVAIDDFGTGYSSLSRVHKFPLDALKIDQSFVRQITTIPNETSIVSAIISMGKSLNLRVVAEGVESEEELAFLQAHHCDEAQGYYFSRPVPPQQFAKFLETRFTLARNVVGFPAPR